MNKELLVVDVPNKNGRIYPREVVEREVVRVKKELIAENRFLISREVLESSVLDLTKVVAVGKDLFFEGDTLFVDLEILEGLPHATEIDDGLKSGRLAVRTAGFGTLQKRDDGAEVVEEGWEFLYCFVTSEPA